MGIGRGLESPSPDKPTLFRYPSAGISTTSLQRRGCQRACSLHPLPPLQLLLLLTSSLPSKHQNSKGLPLGLCHCVPLWWPYCRWQAMAKQTPNKGMLCRVSPSCSHPQTLHAFLLGSHFSALGWEPPRPSLSRVPRGGKGIFLSFLQALYRKPP